MLSVKARLVLLLMVSLVAAGCLGGSSLLQERGDLFIRVEIPHMLQARDLSTQSIVSGITLKEMVFQATKGSMERTVSVAVDSADEEVEVAISGLPAGDWEVHVVAMDTEDYEVALGTAEVTINAGVPTEQDITLDLLPGELVLQVFVPDDDTITSGMVTLMGLVSGIADIEKSFASQENETITLEIGEVPARIWVLQAELTDASGNVVLSGQAQIPVLPGRETTGEVRYFSQAPGGLDISVYWVLPPDTVENITAVYHGGTVTLSWEQVAGVEGYMVIRSLSEADQHGIVVQDSLITGTSVQDNGPFEDGATYYYRVVAYDSQGWSSYFSDLVQVTIAPATPEPGEAGDRTTHTVQAVDFSMRLAPAASFPAGPDDSETDTVDTPFWIAETQVTFELWREVREWGEANGYTFANPGQSGSDPDRVRLQEPVTRISWRDSIVWSNALSEMLDYPAVYTYQGSVLRDATDATACDNAVQEENNGFRLPASREWELAARYIDGTTWTPGNYASGATASTEDSEATQAVAWYLDNSNGQTHEVGQKLANALGLFDMSGNVWEFCFDAGLLGRFMRGGSWYTPNNDWLHVAWVDSTAPEWATTVRGIRLVRTAL